jgi:hypothetical protein
VFVKVPTANSRTSEGGCLPAELQNFTMKTGGVMDLPMGHSLTVPILVCYFNDIIYSKMVCTDITNI